MVGPAPPPALVKGKVSGLSETENNTHLSVTESSSCFIVVISRFDFTVVLKADKTETGSPRSVTILNLFFLLFVMWSEDLDVHIYKHSNGLNDFEDIGYQ